MVDDLIRPADYIVLELGRDPFASDRQKMRRESRKYDFSLVTHEHRDHNGEPGSQYGSHREQLVDRIENLIRDRRDLKQFVPKNYETFDYSAIINGSVHMLPVAPVAAQLKEAKPVETYPLHGSDSVTRARTLHGSYTGFPMDYVYHTSYVFNIDGVVIGVMGDNHGQMKGQKVKVDDREIELLDFLEEIGVNVLISDGVSISHASSPAAIENGIQTSLRALEIPTLKYFIQDHHASRFDPDAGELMGIVQPQAEERGIEYGLVSHFIQNDGHLRGFKAVA